MSQAPLGCAKDRPIDCANGMPNMAMAFGNWIETGPVLILHTVLKQGEAVRLSRTTIAGTAVQPLSAQKIAMKPEGERAWKWWMIHATNALDAMVGDVIEIRKVGYRLMAKFDFSRNGYSHFEAVEDYRHA